MKSSINHLKNEPTSNLSNRSSHTNTSSTTGKATSNHSSENNKFEFHNNISKEFNFNGPNSEINEENNIEIVFKILKKYHL